MFHSHAPSKRVRITNLSEVLIDVHCELVGRYDSPPERGFDASGAYLGLAKTEQNTIGKPTGGFWTDHGCIPIRRSDKIVPFNLTGIEIVLSNGSKEVVTKTNHHSVMVGKAVYHLSAFKAIIKGGQVQRLEFHTLSEGCGAAIAAALSGGGQ